jgi:hypothetical protein
LMHSHTRQIVCGTFDRVEQHHRFTVGQRDDDVTPGAEVIQYRFGW